MSPSKVPQSPQPKETTEIDTGVEAESPLALSDN
jgi:hypothetical protein